MEMHICDYEDKANGKRIIEVYRWDAKEPSSEIQASEDPSKDDFKVIHEQLFDDVRHIGSFLKKGEHRKVVLHTVEPWGDRFTISTEEGGSVLDEYDDMLKHLRRRVHIIDDILSKS